MHLTSIYFIILTRLFPLQAVLRSYFNLVLRDPFQQGSGYRMLGIEFRLASSKACAQPSPVTPALLIRFLTIKFLSQFRKHGYSSVNIHGTDLLHLPINRVSATALLSLHHF